MICIRHIIEIPITPPSRKPIIKNRNSCIVKILSCIGVLGAAPNELLLFLPDRSKNSLLAVTIQLCDKRVKQAHQPDVKVYSIVPKAVK